MSDSDESGVTYTDISSAFEELSDIGSPRADDHDHLELSEILEDPYTESPEYVLEYDFEAHPEDDDDEDPDTEDEEEEHPAPSDSIVAASTSYSPPLPPLLLLISASISSPPLQPPSASRREDRPEVTLPPRKKLGESSSAAAARPAGGLRADYDFVATMDREIMRDPEREVGYGITDSWDKIVETLQGAPTERQLLAGWLNMLFRDRRAHTYTCHLMETEARMSREAWVRSTDVSDLVRDEVMSLRTTILGQMTEIRELHAADRRRQTMISEMLRADHKRSTEIIELRIALQG
nr:hypothetical protein [Tanacetum cinerariifolium]